MEYSKLNMKLNEINILGIPYKIEYLDNPSEVDIYKRESLWGQIDYWTRTIRIYNNNRPIEDVFQTILHEIFHGISSKLNLKLDKDNESHEKLDMLATALSDVLIRNDLLKMENII